VDVLVIEVNPQVIGQSGYYRCTLAQEGQPAKDCYVIVKGEVKVSWGGKLLCRCIEEDCFGDEALIKCGM
jgi:CRP-like cAMP-binding protein